MEDANAATPPQRAESVFAQVWPAALAVLLAAGMAYGLADGRDLAPVIAASGFVYLGAAAAGRPKAAWPAFAITFLIIGLGKVTGIDASVGMLGMAAVVAAVAVILGRTRPAWSLPLQGAAMVVLGAVAILAARVNPTAGGLVVAAAMLAHAAWDVYHHRVDRVVHRSMSRFCGVLDSLVALVVLVVTLTA